MPWAVRNGKLTARWRVQKAGLSGRAVEEICPVKDHGSFSNKDVAARGGCSIPYTGSGYCMAAASPTCSACAGYGSSRAGLGCRQDTPSAVSCDGACDSNCFEGRLGTLGCSVDGANCAARQSLRLTSSPTDLENGKPVESAANSITNPDMCGPFSTAYSTPGDAHA